MASLWKHPKSQFWTACFTDDNGRQLKRSTKLTDRNKATLMAQKFEAAYRMKLTEAQARKVVSDIFEQIHGEQLYHATVRKFLTDWMTNKKSETSPGTHKRYQNAVDKLLDFLGDRADRDIAYVHKRDLAALRDKTAAELSVSTANTDLKILRVAFHQAVIDGLRLDNPGASVRTLEERKSSDAPERRPFTEKELKTLFAVAEGEWEGLLLGGLYTGQRLGDLASLTGRRIDLGEELLTFRSQKTGRDMVIPIAAPFLAYRNRRIGEFLKELELSEGRGTGIPKILESMRANGSPEPQFETDEHRTSFLVRLPLRLAPKVEPTVSNSASTSTGATLGAEKVAPKVEPKVVGRLTASTVSTILTACLEAKRPSELHQILGVKDRMVLLYGYLTPLIEQKWLTRTQPLSPNSPTQRYAVTDAGKVWLAAHAKSAR